MLFLNFEKCKKKLYIFENCQFLRLWILNLFSKLCFDVNMRVRNEYPQYLICVKIRQKMIPGKKEYVHRPNLSSGWQVEKSVLFIRIFQIWWSLMNKILLDLIAVKDWWNKDFAISPSRLCFPSKNLTQLSAETFQTQQTERFV